MLPYLIAGAIGFVVGKLLEEDETPKYDDGGFIKIKSFKSNEGEFDVYDVDENHKNRADMFVVFKDKKGWVVRNVIVPKEFQRKGIATKFYINMNKMSLKNTGKPLHSAKKRKLSNGQIVHELSEDGIAFWDSLVRNGYAKKVSEKNYVFIHNEYADGGSVLLAPNGKPSNLTPEQYKLVRTPAFKQWFGDWENSPENAGEFIDENGEPKVALHHTKKMWVGEGGDENGDETQFNASSWSKDTGNYLFETPKTSVNPTWFYMYPEKSIGKKHFGSVIDFYGSDWAIPFFINVKKIFDTCDSSQLKKLEKYAVKTYGNNFIGLADEVSCDSYGSVEDTYSFSGKDTGSGSIPALIKEMGYDAYTIKDEGGTMAVFDKGNYKLADGNNTTFDSNNPDIRFDGGGNT